MKTKIWLLAISFLFSSCYSYKRVNMGSDHLVLGAKYRVMTMNNVSIKGNLLQANDSIITIRIKSGQPVEIPVSKLYSMQKPKFSIVKSIGLAGSVVGIYVFARAASRETYNYNYWFTNGNY